MSITRLSYSLKYKLYGFVVLAICLVFSLIGTGVHYYGKIEAANETKAFFNCLMNNLQELRVAEKTYLQFFAVEFKAKFGEFIDKADESFVNKKAQGNSPEVKQHLGAAQQLIISYRQLFTEFTVVHEEHDMLKDTMRKPLTEALRLIGEIQGNMEARESELQIQGSTLSAAESELANVTRDCRIDFLQLQNIQYQFLATGDPKFIEAFKKVTDDKVKADLIALKTFGNNLNNKKFVEHAKVVEESVASFLKLTGQSQQLGAKERETAKKMDAVGFNAIEPVEKAVALTSKLIDDEKKSALTSIFIIVVIGLLVFIGFSMIIVGMVTKPLVQVVAGLKDIAEGEGDLTHRLDVKSKDEMGELAKWFNIFIEKIQLLIQEMSLHASKVQTSSQGLLTISESLSAGVEQTSQKASSVAGAGKEMSVNMNSVAASMAEAASNVNMVASAVEEMTATINEIAENTEKARNITSQAVNETEAATNQINSLGSAAKDIGKVIETITEISEQVNLLALNATIEAARAGEYGKGFAVVANEIKELAKQTASATNEIKQRVQGIQDSTKGTVAEIGKISQVVEQVNLIVGTIATAVEEQSATTREMAENVTQVSYSIGEVNNKVSESSTVSAEIAQEITEVMIAAKEMSVDSSQVDKSSHSLSGLADELYRMVGRFKV
ncbi:MAG: methyl-accepting chemotaxis protein [Pseudomonadota bacterium]